MFLFFFIVCMLLLFLDMLKMQEKGFTIISTVVGTILIAILFTGSSIFWTKDIAYDTETIQHLEFGWPVSFYVQNQDMLDPPFPYEMNFYAGSIRWGATEGFIKKNFYTSLAINFSGTLSIWLLIIFYLKIVAYKRKS